MPFSGPIQDNDGLVLQVVGDAVMALWSSPEPDQGLKRAACRAAIGITNAVEQFNRRAGSFAMPTRVGIHAGEMLLGNIGAGKHFEYRPVGDIVNTASRLEGLNKHLGSQMLVSQDALGLGMDVSARSVGCFVFKGKSNPVHVHQLLDPISQSSKQEVETFRLFDQGLKAFQQRSWEESEAIFDRVLAINETDGPSLFYKKHCRKMVQTPPHEKWAGEVYLQKK
jgi:adenylate cyclase